MARFGFRFDRMWPVAAALGVGPRASWLDVESGRLRVRMGWAFSLDVPLDAIASGDRITDESFWQRLTVGVHGRNRTWRVNGATTPAVRLRFGGAQGARTAFFPIKVETLEVNPEDPTAFLTAIGHPSG